MELPSMLLQKRSMRSIPPVYAPSLVFTHGENHRDQTFCTLHDGKSHVRSVPEMRRMRCLASSFGWFVLQKYSSAQCYLFNPTSLEKIDLPPLTYKSFDVGVLTYSPTDTNCVIVLVSEKENSFIFCRIGDNKWTEQGLKQERENGKHLRGYDIGVTSCEGKVYVFCRQWTNVIRFNHTSAYVELLDVRKPEWSVPETCSLVQIYVESCGEIFQVIQMHLGLTHITRTVDVFKLDLYSMVWVKVETLGNQIFLLSASSGTALSATELGLKGDCIYFLCQEYTSLYRFDMDDGTITVTLPCQKKFRHWGEPFWMVPNCKLQMMRELVIVEETKDRVNKDNANIDDLPTDIFNLVLSNLFLDDWIRFRLTSKAWRSITPPIRPYSLVKQYKSKSQLVPWLLSFLNNKGVCNLYHPLYSDTYTMNIPELAGAIVRDAKFGWLLMSRGETSIFFFNPLTMETIELPGRGNYYTFVNVSFSSPPTSSDCIVFGQDLYAKMSVYLKKCETWFDYWIEEASIEFVPSYCNPVFSDGVFYSLSRDGKLGVFYPSAKEGSEWKVLPVPPVVCFGDIITNTSIRRFIMGHEDEIFSAALGYMGKPVSVFKLDRSRMEWHRLESLSDKVAFLSHTSSMLVPAQLKGVENRIYLPKFQGKDSMFYSMKTGKYHCFGSIDSQVDWTNTSEHWNCTWIDSIL